MHSLLTTSIALLAALHISLALQWDYGSNGPDVWSDAFPACAGRSQSPIDIRTACTIYRPYSPFQLSSAYSQPQKFRLVNNGHSIVATYIGDDPSSFTLIGGGLNGTFKLKNFHLHWGENYRSGSEHIVNGKKFSGEIHFVHENSETGELAVLGMFITSLNQNETKHDSSNSSIFSPRDWRRYLAVLRELPQMDQSAIAHLNLSWLEKRGLANFWRYAGSLTTPPCTENVTWTLMLDPIIVHEDEFQFLRHDVLTKSFRLSQPLHDRVVFQSFPPKSEVSKLEYIACLLHE